MKTRNRIPLYLSFVLFVASQAISCKAQQAIIPEAEIIQDAQDSLIFQTLAQDFSKQKNLPVGELMTAIGKSFTGTPYVAHTLENESDEKLVINLRELDCTTFVENCLALARTIKSDDSSYPNFQKNLQQIRYRKGIRAHYPSRLHYFSDWLFDNSGKKIITLPAEQLGEIFPNQVNFMSQHPNSYSCLKANPAFVKELEQLEDSISSKEYYYIPKAKIATIENQLKEGDIAGITTNINGLDIVHTVLLTKVNGRIHLLHASTTGMKVRISEEPLADYLANNKIQTGIMIGRATY